MKKFIFLLLLITFSKSIFSQDFHAGIRFGLAASQVNGDMLSGFNKAGLIGGAYVYRNLSDNFSLQMEMVYIQKGSRKPTDDNNTFYKLQVHYIEVPLFLRWHTSKKIDITGGFAFGTLIFSEEGDQFGVYENAEPFEKFEFSGNAGIIYKLGNNWSFDGRFSQSITTIRPFPGSTTTYFNSGQYNVVMEFTLMKDF
jgi:hypothetical protein